MDTYVERIDNALRVLRSIKDEEFQINAWPRCVLGHCARDSWFNKNGFEFNRNNGSVPAFDGEIGCLAGSKFFGISLDVSLRLFASHDPILGNSAYASRNPPRKAAIAHLEVLRWKKLAELEVGTPIEAKDFVAAE